MKNIESTHYKKYLQVLEVCELSTKEEIKKSYLRLIKQCHPDKFPYDIIKELKATEQSKILNEADEILKNYRPQIKIPSPDFKPNYSSSKSKKPGHETITRVRVKSSNIHSIGYDTALKILQIEFRDGSIYEYYQVTEELFNELMEAGSKGKFANHYIFKNHPYVRV